MSEERLEPKLRFMDYSNSWVSNKIDDVCIFVRDGTHGSFKDAENGIPLLSAKDISDGKIHVYEDSRRISIDDYNTIHKKYELEKGDILVTIVGTIGRTAMVDNSIRFTLQRSVAILRTNNNVSNNFVYYYIQSPTFQKRLKSVVNQSAQGGVYLNSLKNLKISISNNLNEQKKISDCLMQIDKKIELLENKYQKYIDFKKYLMQQIFAQKLRFANFTDDWKNCKFKDLGTVKSGVGFSTKYQGHLDLEYNLYKVSDMNLKGNEKIMVKSNNTIDDFILNEMNAKLITEPSIIFAKVGEAIFLNRKRIANKPFLIDNNMMAFTPNDKVNIDFMYYLSTTINFGKYAQTGALPSYNASDINTIKCKIPSKEEQEKIANILSLSDEKIDFYNDQLEKTKEFKKGLLQQMFV